MWNDAARNEKIEELRTLISVGGNDAAVDELRIYIDQKDTEYWVEHHPQRKVNAPEVFNYGIDFDNMNNEQKTSFLHDEYNTADALCEYAQMTDRMTDRDRENLADGKLRLTRAWHTMQALNIES